MSLSKFEKKKQKLLQKNARLQGKKDPLESTTNNQDTNESDSASLEWKELIRLLCTKDIVLKPQELFEYLALLIQSFAGTNITVILNRNAICLSQNNKHNVSNIACIIPIINDPRWKSSNTNSKLHVHKYSVIDNNISAFGILTDRKTVMRKSVESYQLTPYFLTNKYEWQCITNKNGIYFSTLCKDYRVTGSSSFKQKIVDNSYRNSSNIQDGVIICNNKYGYIPLFCSQNDIFYTDPRIYYKDIKKQWKDNIPKDEIIKVKTENTAYFKKKKKKISQINPRLKDKKDTISETKINENNIDNNNIQNDESKIYDIDDYNNDSFNISLSIMDDKFSSENTIIRLWTQSNGKIYVLRADGILYNIIFCDNNNNEEKESKENENINEIMCVLDSKQPNYKMSARKGAFSTDLIVKVWKYDPNMKNMNSKFELKCNKKLKKYKLFDAIECDKFDMVSYNQRVHNLNATYDTMHNTLIYGIYYDSIGLYIVQNTFDRRNNIHSWDLGFVFNKNIDDKLVKEYEKLYDEFMEKYKYLKEEECYIMFVDERNMNKKCIIIICGGYLVNINMLNNNELKKKELIGNVYNLNEIINEFRMGINVRGGKWYYSYVKQTLYVFERMSVSSNHPYKLRKIALSSFQFPKL